MTKYSLLLVAILFLMPLHADTESDFEVMETGNPGLYILVDKRVPEKRAVYLGIDGEYGWDSVFKSLTLRFFSQPVARGPTTYFLTWNRELYVPESNSATPPRLSNSSHMTSGLKLLEPGSSRFEARVSAFLGRQPFWIRALDTCARILTPHVYN